MIWENDFNAKKWYQSKTMKVNIAFIIFLAAQIILDGNIVQQFVPLQYQALVLAIANTIIRTYTDKKITL